MCSPRRECATRIKRVKGKIYDSPLNFQALSIVVKNYLKNSKDEFEASKFSAILKQLESYKVEDRSNPAKIAKSIVSNLDPSDYDKPFYRALTLILIVHSMTDDFETKDFVIKNEDDFYRRTGIHSYEITIHGCFPFFRERAEIALNNKNQILFKGERLENIETLSDEVSNIFTINRGLGKQKTNDAMRSPGNEGYNFPFYSYTSKEDLTTDVNRAIQNYDRAKSIPNMQLDMLAISSRMIKDCLKKKIIAQLYGKTLFPEISLHAELQVLRLDETDPTLLEKVYAEIFESIDALRSKESESVFDETYSKIKSRQNIFLNDFRKLRLLEVLFSLRVTENPNQFDPPEPPYYP